MQQEPNHPILRNHYLNLPRLISCSFCQSSWHVDGELGVRLPFLSPIAWLRELQPEAEEGVVGRDVLPRFWDLTQGN